MEQRIEGHNTRLNGDKCTEGDREWRPGAVMALENQIGIQSRRRDGMQQVETDSNVTIIAKRVGDL